MAQTPLLNVVQVSTAGGKPFPPQAVRPDWECFCLASGSGGRVQRLLLLRMTSTDVPAVSSPPVMIIASAERRILMEENKILSSTNNNDASYGWKFEITLVHVDRAMNVFLPRPTGWRS